MIKFKDFTKTLLPGDNIIELYRWDPDAYNPELVLTLSREYTWQMDKFFKPYFDLNVLAIRFDKDVIKLYITEGEYEF